MNDYCAHCGEGIWFFDGYLDGMRFHSECLGAYRRERNRGTVFLRVARHTPKVVIINPRPKTEKELENEAIGAAIGLAVAGIVALVGFIIKK